MNTRIIFKAIPSTLDAIINTKIDKSKTKYIFQMCTYKQKQLPQTLKINTTKTKQKQKQKKSQTICVGKIKLQISCTID